MDDSEFKELVEKKGRELYRDMPWRRDISPYYVLVSEMMLQQTQVSRVVPKFNEFVYAYPDFSSLAAASLGDVVHIWQGLGYNRRAKYLSDAARIVTASYGGQLPDSIAELQQLPGVGKNTAGAILAYSYGRPAVFIETNVRAVYLFHYFKDKVGVSDSEIEEIVKRTLPDGDAIGEAAGGTAVYGPREFYWALMDYGSWLKSQGLVRNSQSGHYKKQSPLSGSVRQVRGQIIRRLTVGDINDSQLRSAVGDKRYEAAVAGLIRDGLITVDGGVYRLTR